MATKTDIRWTKTYSSEGQEVGHHTTGTMETEELLDSSGLTQHKIDMPGDNYWKPTCLLSLEEATTCKGSISLYIVLYTLPIERA